RRLAGDSDLLREELRRRGVKVRAQDEIDRLRLRQADAAIQLDVADGAVEREALDRDAAVAEANRRRALLGERQTVEIDRESRERDLPGERADVRTRRFDVGAHRDLALQLVRRVR